MKLQTKVGLLISPFLFSHSLLSLAETATSARLLCGEPPVASVEISNDQGSAELVEGATSIRLERIPSSQGMVFRENDIALQIIDGRPTTLVAADGRISECHPLIQTSAVATNSFVPIRGNIRLPPELLAPLPSVLAIRIARVGRNGSAPLNLAEIELPLLGGESDKTFETVVDRSLLPKDGQLLIAARLIHRGRTLARSEPGERLAITSATDLAIHLHPVAKHQRGSSRN